MTTPQDIAARCLTIMTDAGLGPSGKPCGVCINDPEQRHRAWDTIAERWQVGESLDELAVDYCDDAGPDAVAAVLIGQAAWLTAEARWWAEEAVQQLNDFHHSQALTLRTVYGRVTVHFPWQDDDQ